MKWWRCQLLTEKPLICSYCINMLNIFKSLLSSWIESISSLLVLVSVLCSGGCNCNFFFQLISNNKLTNLDVFAQRGLHSGQSRLRRTELLPCYRQPPHRPSGQTIVDIDVRDTPKGAILYPLPSGSDAERSEMFLVWFHTWGPEGEPEDFSSGS